MRASYASWFLATVSIVLAAVFVFNALADCYILGTPNGQSLETVAGFERVIKPAWLAATRPQIVLVGSSRVRDAFDPVLIAKATGLHIFNYGVSSVSAYETRRFAQDAASYASVKTIIISLDGFVGGTTGQGGAGFDEMRLAVTPNGDRTPRRGLWLFTTRYLGGGALGMHAQGVYLLSSLHSGETVAERPDLFDAYARMTPKIMASDLQHRRGRVMRMTEGGYGQLRALLTAVCRRDLNLILYFPADRIEMQRLYVANDGKGLTAFKAAVTSDAYRSNAACRSRVSVFDFMVPSRLTADPMVRGESTSYVDLIHIRPPAGLRLLNTMLHRAEAEPALGRELVHGASRMSRVCRIRSGPGAPFQVQKCRN